MSLAYAINDLFLIKKESSLASKLKQIIDDAGTFVDDVENAFKKKGEKTI